MKSITDLVESAAELAAEGRSKGEIADELNVSRETASWLVDHARSNGAADAGTDDSPEDVHVDWNAIGRDSTRLHHVGAALADLLSKQGSGIDLTVGVEKAGVPLATTVGRELDTDLAAYAPAKHRWNDGGGGDRNGSGRDSSESGTFSRNFADIRGRECYVVDDTITSGTTMRETIAAVRDAGGDPVGCGVLVDKRGIAELDGVPVHSLIGVVRVEGNR